MSENKIENSKLPLEPSGNDALRQKVEEALDQIRPAIEMDGGFVEVNDIVDGVVYVEMRGACGSCPSSAMTLKAGIERIILEQVPGIKAVEAV
ncbi:MAG: NifU family protein [Elusimicrobia bacterium]|nr:NifU family protein [Elusimicrobiota bacterium]